MRISGTDWIKYCIVYVYVYSYSRNIYLAYFVYKPVLQAKGIITDLTD